MKADIFLAMKYERLIMRLEEVCFEIGAGVGTARNWMSARTPCAVFGVARLACLWVYAVQRPFCVRLELATQAVQALCKIVCSPSARLAAQDWAAG